MSRMFAAFLLMTLGSVCGAETVTIRFRGLSCGEKLGNVGVTKSTITVKDARFYVHNVRLLDSEGREVPVDLAQDGRRQFDDVALVDLCAPHGELSGVVPAGVWSGLRFTLGVPAMKNHTDLTALPSPLNLTAMAWTWNAGRRFARIEFASVGRPRGFAIHLGSTGCVPGSCVFPNRAEVEITGFDPARDDVVADLAELLSGSNVDADSGCESDPETPACGPLFARLGLPFKGVPAVPQSFFHK
jgi:uncharacterized repeat protein (TIGR04052 family)